MTKSKKKDLRIEPSRGLTYASEKFAVYEYGTYGRSSVLAGREKRMWLDDFDTVEEAKAAFPDAEVCGCGLTTDPLNDLPGDDDADPYGDNAEIAKEGAE